MLYFSIDATSLTSPTRFFFHILYILHFFLPPITCLLFSSVLCPSLVPPLLLVASSLLLGLMDRNHSESKPLECTADRPILLQLTKSDCVSPRYTRSHEFFPATMLFLLALQEILFGKVYVNKKVKSPGRVTSVNDV